MLGSLCSVSISSGTPVLACVVDKVDLYTTGDAGMEDSVMMARLTLMLLRASVPHPDSLPNDYGVEILPSNTVLSREEAVLELARLTGDQEVSGRASGGNLLVLVSPPTAEARKRIELSGVDFATSIRQLNSQSDTTAQVRVVGFRESLLAPARILEKWFSSVDCADCYIGLSKAASGDPSQVIAVLQFGASQ